MPIADDDLPLPKSMGEVLAGMGITPRGKATPTNWEIEIPRRQREHWESQLRKKPDILRRIGVPQRIADLLLRPGGPDDRPTIQALQRWTESGRSILVLLGANQIGKSVACAYFQSLQLTTLRTMYQADDYRAHAVGQPPSGRWIDFEFIVSNQFFCSAGELAMQKPSWEPESQTVTQRLRECTVLTIDDIGSEMAEISKKLQDVLAVRHAKKLKTLMTSNLSRVDFAAHIGKRLFSRVEGNGQVTEC